MYLRLNPLLLLDFTGFDLYMLFVLHAYCAVGSFSQRRHFGNPEIVEFLTFLGYNMFVGMEVPCLKHIP